MNLGEILIAIMIVCVVAYHWARSCAEVREADALLKKITNDLEVLEDIKGEENA